MSPMSAPLVGILLIWERVSKVRLHRLSSFRARTLCRAWRINGRLRYRRPLEIHRLGTVGLARSGERWCKNERLQQFFLGLRQWCTSPGWESPWTGMIDLKWDKGSQVHDAPSERTDRFNTVSDCGTMRTCTLGPPNARFLVPAHNPEINPGEQSRLGSRSE